MVFIKKLIYGLIIILTWNNLSFAEIEILSVKIKNEEDIWELYLENKISWDDYYTLYYLYQHPLDINEAGILQLEELPNISFDLAQQIYQHRPFKKLEEIIPIIGKDLFEQMRVFIQVKQLWPGDFNLWMTETQDDNKKADLKTKLSLYRQGLELGSFGKRDEELELKKRYLMLEKDNFHPLRKVVLGNYQARFGAGVVFNTAHRKTYRGVVPDDLERKSDIQDGILIETAFDRLNSTIFYSWVDLDQFPSSVLSEFNGKEKLWGGNLNLTKGDSYFGATGYASNFTSKDGENKRIEILGLDFLKRFKETELVGEIGWNKNQNKGLLLSGYKKISNFKYWLSLRRYEQGFINPHSQIKEGDEQGGVAKIEYDANRLKFKISGDYHKHFSTLRVDETYWFSLEYKLSTQREITTKIEYEDEDVGRAGDKKMVYSLALDTKPHFQLDINSFYQYTNKDKKISDYASTKVTYYFHPMITLTGRFKYGPKGKREIYGQMKVKIGEKELITKYTYTHSLSHPYKFYVRMRVKW